MTSIKEKLAYVFKYAPKSDEKLQKIIRLAATMDNANSKLNEEQKAKVKQALNQAYDKVKAINDQSAVKSKTTGKKQSSKTSDIKSALSDFKQKVGKIEYKRAIRGTDIPRDINRPALPSGKRVTRKKGYTTNQYGRHANKVGSVYYESRANRMDVNQPSKSKYPKLAKGGKIGELKEEDFVWNELGKKLIVREVNNDEYLLEGFGSISPSPFAKSKVHNYLKSGQWTRKPKMAKGGQTGKLKDGVYRVGKPKKVSKYSYEQKIVEIFKDGSIATASDYGRKMSDFSSQKYPVISEEQFEAQYKFAKGGMVVTKIADIPNFKERLAEGKITYRGLGLGKAFDDFYKIAGTHGTRIKVDGKEYFITEEEFDTFNRDKITGKLIIPFDAPYRKFKEGGEVKNLFVVVGEKDDYWTITSKPTTKYLAQKLLAMTNFPKGETGKVVSVEKALNYQRVIGKEYLKEYEGGGEFEDKEQMVIKDLEIKVPLVLREPTMKVEFAYESNDGYVFNVSSNSEYPVERATPKMEKAGWKVERAGKKGQRLLTIPTAMFRRLSASYAEGGEVEKTFMEIEEYAKGGFVAEGGMTDDMQITASEKKKSLKGNPTFNF